MPGFLKQRGGTVANLVALCHVAEKSWASIRPAKHKSTPAPIIMNGTVIFFFMYNNKSNKKIQFQKELFRQ